MKIVHVMNWYIPQMGYQENFLPAEQKKLGHEVEIITSDRVPNYQGYKKNIGIIIGDRMIGAGIFKDNDVTIYRLPTIIEIEEGGLIVLKGLKSKLKELNPDVVHAHGSLCPSTIESILYRKQLDYTLFIDDHTHETNFHLNKLHKQLYFKMMKIFYLWGQKQVCSWLPVTHSARNFLKTQLKIPDSKLFLLPLGANTNIYYKSPEFKKMGRAKFNLSLNDILIISTGKFHEAKDIHNLIKALKPIIVKYPNIKLLLLGNGSKEYMDSLKDLISSLDLIDNIIFKNFVPNSELPIYYNAADIGVWPGNPSITVIEAVATGLPVIVPKTDLAYDILFKNNAAQGFERANVESLSLEILNLIENEELRNFLSTNSLNLVSNSLSWKKIAEYSLDIYASHKTCYLSKFKIKG